jgi:hypothetical protein
MRTAFGLALFVLLAISMVFAEFQLESSDTQIHSIDENGGTRVTESVKFFVIGSYDQERYKNGLSSNDLSSWADLTGIGEVRMHVDGSIVDIRDLSLRPQSLGRCDTELNRCHGEIILSYSAYPYVNKTTGETIRGTGLFYAESYKPRTTRYYLNVNALNFRKPQPALSESLVAATTSENNIILDKKVSLTVILPANTVITDLSQNPNDVEISPPAANIKQLSWTNTILSQFTLVFEVEKSLATEVVEFFTNIPKKVQQILFGSQGLAIVLILVILVGSVIYLKSTEKKNKR